MSDRVSVTYENHIAHVRLTRVDKMNAVDQEMIDGIIAAGQEVAASDARVAVISGEGRAFCAGIDRPTVVTTAFSSLADPRSPRTVIIPRGGASAIRTRPSKLAPPRALT